MTRTPHHLRTRSPLLTRAALALLLLTTAAACGGDDDHSGSSSPTIGREGLFTSAVTEVVFEVDYQTGAAPYTTYPLRPGNPWSLFETNLSALFERTGATVTSPRELSEMQDIGDLSDLSADADFTVDELLGISAAHRQQQPTTARRTFHVIFLNGYFTNSEGRQDSVLGVSIGDTGVIAMFKPVIDSTSSARFVEQTTLIHEFGHAAGLVNNGIALTSAHHDAEHGAHCTNDRCVMYYLNEGAAGLVSFIQRYLATGDAVVFGQECLDDIKGAME